VDRRRDGCGQRGGTGVVCVRVCVWGGGGMCLSREEVGWVEDGWKTAVSA